MDYLKGSLSTLTDKLGDATIAVLDEMKFWGEVLVEFLELDKTSTEHALDEYRKELHEQLKEQQECDKVIEKMQKEQSLDNNEISDTEDEEHTKL